MRLNTLECTLSRLKAFRYDHDNNGGLSVRPDSFEAATKIVGHLRGDPVMRGAISLALDGGCSLLADGTIRIGFRRTGRMLEFQVVDGATILGKRTSGPSAVTESYCLLKIEFPSQADVIDRLLRWFVAKGPL